MFASTRVATGQEMVLEKILEGHGETMEVYLESGEVKHFNCQFHQVLIKLPILILLLFMRVNTSE